MARNAKIKSLFLFLAGFACSTMLAAALFITQQAKADSCQDYSPVVWEVYKAGSFAFPTYKVYYRVPKCLLGNCFGVKSVEKLSNTTIKVTYFKTRALS